MFFERTRSMRVRVCSHFGRAVMNDRIDHVISIVAAILVLFTAIIDPRISLVVAVIGLVALAIYKFNWARHS